MSIYQPLAPAGSSNDIQLNLNGGFGVVPGFSWVSGELQVPGDIRLNDGGTFTTTLQCIAPTANRTQTFPDASGTVALVAGSSGQLMFNNAGALGGAGGLTYDASTGLRSSLALGYGAGAGGTVTQATNKSTGVTLNALSGQITLNGANLATGTAVSFTLTNSQIAATDILVVNHVSGGTVGAYLFGMRAAAGSATVTVRNVTAGDLAEAVVIGFAVLKATTT